MQIFGLTTWSGSTKIGWKETREKKKYLFYFLVNYLKKNMLFKMEKGTLLRGCWLKNCTICIWALKKN